MDKTKILMINGSLMEVKSIAECSISWQALYHWAPVLPILFNAVVFIKYQEL